LYGEYRTKIINITLKCLTAKVILKIILRLHSSNHMF